MSIKAKKLLRAKKGVTIVETLMCMVLLTILSVMVIGALSPVLKMYVRSNEVAEANMLLSSVSDEITTNLTRASAVKVNGGQLSITTNSDQISYTVDSTGILYWQGRNISPTMVLDENYYKGKSLVINYLDASGVVIENADVIDPFYVEIKVSSPKTGGEMAVRKFAVNPIGLQIK